MFQGTVNGYWQDRAPLGGYNFESWVNPKTFFDPFGNKHFCDYKTFQKNNMKICLTINNGKKYKLLRNSRENSLQSVLPHILKTFPKNEKHRQSRSGM